MIEKKMTRPNVTAGSKSTAVSNEQSLDGLTRVTPSDMSVESHVMFL